MMDAAASSALVLALNFMTRARNVRANLPDARERPLGFCIDHPIRFGRLSIQLRVCLSLSGWGRPRDGRVAACSDRTEQKIVRDTSQVREHPDEYEQTPIDSMLTVQM